MKLTKAFWKHFELDIQEIRISFLNWAIGYAKEPKSEYQHLFRWDHQDCFCIINSRYGRAFAFSPFGAGVRGVPRSKFDVIPRGLDEIDIALKARLTESTRRIRRAIVKALETGNLNDARQMVLTFIGSSLVHMNFFSIESNLNMTIMGKLERVVGGFMNPRSGERSAESEIAS